MPIVTATAETLARPAPAAGRGRQPSAGASAPTSRAYVEQVHDIERVADRLLDIYARLVSMALGSQMKRLGKHTAIYGIGGLVSRILAVFLLPLYTHYLGPEGFGKIETVIALTTVLVIVLRMGISSAFFRFYFDSKDEAHRRSSFAPRSGSRW